MKASKVTQEYRDKISRRMKEVWAERRMEKALKQVKDKRKTEHCYRAYCYYLTDRRCVCVCAPCAIAKQRDH